MTSIPNVPTTTNFIGIRETSDWAKLCLYHRCQIQDCSQFTLNKVFFLFIRMNGWRRNCVWCVHDLLSPPSIKKRVQTKVKKAHGENKDSKEDEKEERLRTRHSSDESQRWKLSVCEKYVFKYLIWIHDLNR